MFAQACLALEKHSEGITALERSRTLWLPRNNWNKHTESRRQSLPDAAAVHCLQGKLFHAYGDPHQAIECYADALKVNSLMWDAFIGLCDLGVKVRVPNIFKMTPAMMSSLEPNAGEETPFGVLEDSPPLNSFANRQIRPEPGTGGDPFGVPTTRINGDSRTNITKSALYEKLNGSTSTVTPMGTGLGMGFEGLDTPTAPGGGQVEVRINLGPSIPNDIITVEPPLAPARKSRTLAGLGMDFSVDAPPRMKASHARSRSKATGDSEDMELANPSIASIISSGITERKRTVSGQVAQSASSSSNNHSTSVSNDPMAPQRRSVRLFNQIRPHSSKLVASAGSIGAKEGREIKKAKATGTKGRTMQTSTVGRVVSGNRKHGDPMDIDGKEIRTNAGNAVAPVQAKPPPVSEKMKEYESLQWILDLFVKLGSGYFALSHYRCDEAIAAFTSIIPSQRETPWVLAKMGRTLHEQSRWNEAERHFARMKTMAPSTLEDMEVYSTILWHVKNEVDLSFLAHELLEVDRLSPQAWCAVGNSFSLQRDHDQALKCFKRATQLDPKFAYAFALQGHEHVSNEEYDKALSAYRSAIATENRHYNAWYGLGKVFEKQGKYAMAEQHYRTASSINPTSAVLITCIGTVLEKMKNNKAALIQYAKAADMEPKATIPRFKKARVLMQLGQPDLALRELEVLKDLAPDEANVHFLLGRAYKSLRQKGLAIKHFTTALNLDPKVCFIFSLRLRGLAG